MTIYVFSLYLGYDHYGENVNRHLGTFSTKEEAIAEGNRMLTNIDNSRDVFFIEHVLGKPYFNGTDDADVNPITYIKLNSK